jgi:hypothetical protein
MFARFIGRRQGKIDRELPADRFEGVEWRVFLTDAHYNDCVVAVAAILLARRTAKAQRGGLVSLPTTRLKRVSISVGVPSGVVKRGKLCPAFVASFHGY